MTNESIKLQLERVLHLLRNNAPIVIMLCVGLLLLMLGGNEERSGEPAAVLQEPEPSEGESIKRSLAETETRLAAMLSSIEGAGKVQVMLSLESEDETVYAVDTSGEESNIVLISTGSQHQQAVVSGVLCAQYRGAVILAQGADSPKVRLMITQAVSALTGLGADSISVLKME